MEKAFGRLISALVLASALAMAGGCAGAPKRAGQGDGPTAGPTQPSAQASPAPGSGTGAQPYGPPEAYGPPVPSAQPQQPTYGPEPIQYKPLIVVLGPGLARGFAHAGALRALEESKIPIREVQGTEMGGLMAGLYSLNKSLNQLDWALLKLKDDAFVSEGGMLKIFGNASDGKKLEEELAEILPSKDLADGRVPIRVGVLRLGVEQPLLLDRGPAAAALRATMSVPGVMKPYELPGGVGHAISAASRHPYGVAEARKSASGPVVVIDVLSSPEPAGDKLDPKLAGYLQSARKAAKADVGDADLVIRVDLKGVGFLDFKHRTEAQFRGKRAVQAKLKELRQLVGLPVQ